MTKEKIVKPTKLCSFNDEIKGDNIVTKEKIVKPTKLCSSNDEIKGDNIKGKILKQIDRSRIVGEVTGDAIVSKYLLAIPQ